MKGPSFVCDTACSASLVSTHAAKLMMLDPYDPLEFFLSFGAHLVLRGPFINAAHMNSPDGRCFTFNASANGYLRGEGFAVMFLTLENRDEENIAVLRASSSGQDGRSASLTAPNGPAQEEIISRCVKEAKMTPPESTIWECHGTGTSLGDPIEVGAVRKIQIRMPRVEPLMITSNKTNIGHLEGGAAMAAMCKCVLQCEYGKCCPTVHFRTLNAHLEHTAFDALFQNEAAANTYNNSHSQVSSFGFGGSNGHCVFWGRKKQENLDPVQLFLRRIKRQPPPEVRPLGTSPDDWETDLPDTRDTKPGTTWSIALSPDDTASTSLRYVKTEPPELEEDDVFYELSGNFNDWAGDRMSDGNVPGAYVMNIEMPEDGQL